jgi:lipopolysaccharide/colanic/teichoic acid biosynthesis glycosyltransferase
MRKRHLERIAAAAGLVLFSPLLVLIALAIKLDDGGPVLFTQSRLGTGKQPFRIYKFRTMRDGWITGIGRCLRATGLDELPQLANVLVGDMSLIGPRPLTVDDVTRLGWCDERHASRWSVRPGISGLAQLFAGRGARLSWFLDRRYVESSTLRMDTAVGALSIAICLLGKRRVRNWLRCSRLAACARRNQIRRPDTVRAWSPTARGARIRNRVNYS